jgi:hypothetical protein
VTAVGNGQHRSSMPRHSPAPVVNPSLANLLKHEPDPVEALATDQALPKLIWMAGTAKLLASRGRIVRLECGHFKVTKALHRTGCLRCGEMIRACWDHDAFRRLGAEDTFSWPDDPLRILHENTSGPEARFDPTSPR